MCAARKARTIKWIIAIAGMTFFSATHAEFYFDRGEPDAGRHPAVGFMTAADANGNRLPRYCSGTLIAPYVFLTASHCTINVFDRLSASPNFNGTFYVGFGDDFIPAGQPIRQLSRLVRVAAVHTNPDYDFFIMSPQPEHADIAVLILAEDAAAKFGITPVTLPYLGELDAMTRSGAIDDVPYLAVGFGAADVVMPPNSQGGPWNWFTTNTMKYVGESLYLALHPAYMILSMNYATGDSGPCYGDSGGPFYWGDSNKIVAITVWGDTMCRAMTAPLRLDTEGAHQFLRQFENYGVVLPAAP